MNLLISAGFKYLILLLLATWKQYSKVKQASVSTWKHRQVLNLINPTKINRYSLFRLHISSLFGSRHYARCCFVWPMTLLEKFLAPFWSFDYPIALELTRLHPWRRPTPVWLGSSVDRWHWTLALARPETTSRTAAHSPETLPRPGSVLCSGVSRKCSLSLTWLMVYDWTLLRSPLSGFHPASALKQIK